MMLEINEIVMLVVELKFCRRWFLVVYLGLVVEIRVVFLARKFEIIDLNEFLKCSCFIIYEDNLI